MTSPLAADAARLVSSWVPHGDDERETLASFERFFADGRGPVDREAGPDHATASCVVFDRTLTQVLLVFHGKGRFWVQPGGHVEGGDATIVAAALRELREETGVVSGEDAIAGFDLDHHALGNGFACDSHLDFGVAVVVDADVELAVSDESEDVRWFPLDALPENSANGAERRYRSLRDRIARHRAG